eukprot:GHVO01013523.1.p4 GENE.GHVO01013523.1~~GHVO01013523.1.p4  ORF type:complete len:111 (-),score=19.82 GHVO01013523.1:322-654(-)
MAYAQLQKILDHGDFGTLRPIVRGDERIEFMLYRGSDGVSVGASICSDFRYGLIDLTHPDGDAYGGTVYNVEVIIDVPSVEHLVVCGSDDGEGVQVQVSIITSPPHTQRA